jgi:hypothetical protein
MLTSDELAVDDLGQHLVEDLVGHGLSLHGSQRHDHDRRTVWRIGQVT